MNAFTEKKRSTLYAILPVGRILEALDVKIAMINNSILDEHDYSNGRRVILDELIAAIDDSEETACDALAAMLWGGQSLVRLIGDTESSSKRLKHDNVYTYYKENFIIKPIFVSIVDNIDIGIIHKRLESVLASPIINLTRRRFERTIIGMYRALLHQYMRFFAIYEIPIHLSSETYITLELVTIALGDLFRSRLYQVLRESEGSYYSSNSILITYDEFFILVIFTACTSGLLRSFLRKLCDNILCLDDGSFFK